jgi:hypothetical protein
MYTSKLLKGVGAVTSPGVLTIAEALSGEAVSIGTLVDTLIRCIIFLDDPIYLVKIPVRSKKK